jgi:hypothetical protein
MDCIPQSAKSPCRIGTSDEREAVQLEAIYARTAWIVELEASRRDGAVDPFPRRATGRHPRRHDGSVLFGPRLGRGPHNQRPARRYLRHSQPCGSWVDALLSGIALLGREVLTNARGAIGAMCLLEVIPVPGKQMRGFREYDQKSGCVAARLTARALR